jgi:sugar phosphate isomerase/epimerase
VAESGLAIAIEPLRSAESNIITRVSEAARLAEWVAHPTVRVLADLFHMAEEGESPLAVLDAGPLLAHVHVADSGRTPPGEGTEDYRAILAALIGAGYDGGVSVECGWRDFGTQQGAALATLRAALAQAGEGAGA